MKGREMNIYNKIRIDYHVKSGGNDWRSYFCSFPKTIEELRKELKELFKDKDVENIRVRRIA